MNSSRKGNHLQNVLTGGKENKRRNPSNFLTEIEAKVYLNIEKGTTEKKENHQHPTNSPFAP